MEEIEFIVNEAQTSQENKIKEILDIINNPSPEKNAMIMYKLVNVLVQAGKKEEERKEFVSVLKELPEPPVPIRIKKRAEEARQVSWNEYELVKDKDSGITLAKVRVNEKYELNEPKLTEDDVMVIKNVDEIIKKKKISLDNKKVLMGLINKESKKHRINFNDEYFRNIRYYLINQEQYGKITPLILDKNVSAISCFGLDNIKVVYNNTEKESNLFFSSLNELNAFIKFLAMRENVRLDELNPIVDFVREGIRFQLILGFEGVSASFVVKKL